jgi:hypothetical protein
MFEKKIIRRISGPVVENNVWRIRYNEELNALLKGEDTSIVRFTKSQRIRWLGMLKKWKSTLKGRLIQKKERKT